MSALLLGPLAAWLAPAAWANGTGQTANAASAANGTASRIATLDRASTETLLALGVEPIAAGPRSIYEAVGATPPMSARTANIGYWFEPNLEILRELKVDLIVIEQTSIALRTSVARVAPVFVMQIYTGDGHADFIERSSAAMFELAGRIGRVEAAKAYRARLEGRLDGIRRELQPYATRPVLIAQFDSSGQSVLLYAKNCVTWDVMRRLGYASAWTGPTNAYGCAQIRIDELAAMPDADILYIDYGDETTAALAQLVQSPIWRNLPMVRAGRVRPVERFDPLGGLPAALKFAENFRTAVLARRQA